MALKKRTTPASTAEDAPQEGSTADSPGRRGRATATPVAKRRVGGVAVAAALAVVGGVVAYSASLSNDARPYLVANQAIERGDRIESSMLTTVDVAGDPGALVPSDESGAVIGQVAVTDLGPGSTITRTSTAAHVGVESGQALVGLALEVGRAPSRDLKAGDPVTVVFTPGNDNADKDKRGESVAAVVETSGVDETSGKITVDVRVSAQDAPTVASWAATNAVSVVMQGAKQ
ncbi:SAF domain-containing protein [Micrococcus endophyticus]